MNITVIGSGYVGLVTGTCLADAGMDVVCHDLDTAKIELLRSGGVPIYEPGLEELIERNARDGRLTFTSNLREAMAHAEVCFVAVGTPPDADGAADLRYVLGAAEEVARNITRDLVLVVKSTVPIGTCDKVELRVREILAERGVPYSCEVVSNPEFLKEGKAIQDFITPDRIVVGVASEHATRVMQELYEPFIRSGNPLLVMDRRSSEMTKYAANVMLAARISLMNEFAQLCERVGADITHVRQGIGADSRIGLSFLYAGIGYGGSCFPKDVQALARTAVEVDLSADILEAVHRVNRHQKMVLANKVVAHFDGDVRDRTFALWGLAFKADTDDIREAPSLTIIKRLTDAGAKIRAYDPEALANGQKLLADNPNVSFVDDQYEALEGAHGLIVATEWRQFRRPDLDRVKQALELPVVFDGRNLYRPEDMRRRGLRYYCIGRAPV